MGKLIKAEFLKLSRLRGYKILLLFITGMGILMGYFLANLPASDLPAGYYVQDGHNIYMLMLADTEVFMSFSLIFVAIFVCTEFSGRTFSMNLFSGCPRHNILLAKIYVYLIGLVPVVVLAPLMAGLTGSIGLGFGHLDSQMWFALIRITLLAILGNTAMGCFCLMIAVLFKNIVWTIGVGFAFMILIQAIKTFPTTRGSLLQPEYIEPFIVVNIVILVVTLIASFVIFQKSDLK